jgi:hypothetical protein
VSLANLSTYVAHAGRLARPELDTPAIGIARPTEALILATAQRCYEAHRAAVRNPMTSTPWNRRTSALEAVWRAVALAALDLPPEESPS